MTKTIDFDRLAFNYNTANLRLILFDYDGTLVPFENDPSAVEWELDSKACINALAADKRNHVVLISGRDKKYLELVARDIPITLVAEHGGFYKNPGSLWRQMFPISGDWILKTLPAFRALAFHYEGSLLEQKTFSLVWHYRGISDRITESEKKQILSAIKALPQYDNFLVHDDECNIELRTPGIHEGSFIARWVGNRKYDFVMAVGGRQTDGDLFKVLANNAYTIKVGKSFDSIANFHLDDQQDVIPFMEWLVMANRDFERMKANIGLGWESLN